MSNAISRRSAMVGLSATVLAGCTAAPPPPARKFYLSPLEAPPEAPPKINATLVVEPPQTPTALRTTRIAQVIGENEFDYYADAEWGDLAPEMFQATLIRSFERSGALTAVVNERERLRPDYMLETRLSPFYAIGAVGSAPQVRVGVDARLVRSRGRELIASTTIAEERLASGREIENVVAAFDAASKAVMSALIRWTAKGISSS